VRPLRIWGEGSEFPLRKYDSGVRIWVAVCARHRRNPKVKCKHPVTGCHSQGMTMVELGTPNPALARQVWESMSNPSQPPRGGQDCAKLSSERAPSSGRLPPRGLWRRGQVLLVPAEGP
jgi:hypothetical protein